jgi:hypothetical protein
MPLLFHDDPAKRSVRTAIKLRCGQASNKTSYCSCSRSRLGSSSSENETTNRPQNRAHSTECRHRAKTGVERHVVRATPSAGNVPMNSQSDTCFLCGLRHATIEWLFSVCGPRRENREFGNGKHVNCAYLQETYYC